MDPFETARRDPPATAALRLPHPILQPCPHLVAGASTHPSPGAAGETRAADRCGAFAPPLTLSLRQRELVCGTDGHQRCPRYLRGGAVVARPGAGQRGTRLPLASAAALAILAVAVVAAVAYAALGGGLGIAAAPSVTPLPGSASPSPSSGTPSPTATPRASVAPPSVSPSAPPPSPSGSFASQLTPCPGQADCYLYRVRAGDSLGLIADRFGITVASILAMNPGIANPSLIHVGEQLRLPPPTR